MTISSSTSRNDYIGNGATKVFPYTFRVFLESELQVIVRDEDGVETTLVLNTDYSVDVVDDPSGGNITLLDAGQDWLDGDGDLLTDYVITIRRVVPLTQETDIANQGSFFPAIHEKQFDRLVMIAQQQQDDLDRACKNPVTVATSEFDPELPADIATANRALVTNNTGDGFTLSLFSVADAERIFKRATSAQLQALAIADPTAQRFGWATDLDLLLFYTGDTSEGDNGWIVLGGG